MSEPARPENQPVRLQQFGLKDSIYERPNQTWVCGRLCEGSPCDIGPNARGMCVATAECRPVKKGDRWVCTRRSASTAPNPCQEGPSPDGQCACSIAPCSPQRSTRSRRARWAFMAFALSIGVLAFFLLEPGRSSFVSPGELTDAHAQVLKTQRAEECGACHAAGARHANGWIRLALSPGVGAVQNDKCLVCHRAKLGEDSGLPHSLAAATLSHITAAAPASPPATARQILASFAPPPATTAHGDIACSTCHQEHGGRRQNLKSLSDLSCQSCHKTQFESFAYGHPEFKPVRHDRDGIIFDHVSHEPRMAGGKFDCAKCHFPDPVGKTMQFATFAQACSGCHDQGKLDHHGDQIHEGTQVVLQLPAMSLEKPAVWPAAALAPGNQLTPMLQFLIAGDRDPAVVKALKSLSSDVVANGSTDDWDADPPTKARLALAIERVVKELLPDDAAAPQPSNRDLLRARIARAAGVPETAPPVTELLDRLTASADTIKSWQEHTLPQLAQDLSRSNSPASAPASAPATAPASTGPASAPAADADAPAAAATEWKLPAIPAGWPGWFVDAKAVSINYRPIHGDPLYKACIDLLAARAKPAKIVTSMSDEDFLAALRVQLLQKVGSSCIKCHEVQSANGAYVVNWQPAGHVTRVPGYVKFDHKPHLTLLMGDDKCSVCHKLQSAPPAPANVPANPTNAPATVVLFPTDKPNHNVGAHDKANCASCHRPTGSPDTCLTCHVYHMIR